jgi:outer membrane lipoprotein carrier protein
MKRRTVLSLVPLLAFAGGAAAQASSVDQLRAYLAQTQSARGEFTQKVSGRNAAAAKTSSGNFMFQRPGKFRWTYDKPFEQVIVADGEKLYLYDKDLNQVTVKKLGAALPASPASILFGSNDFERDFEVKDAGTRDGISWVAAVPHAKDSPFERIEIGLRDGQLAGMLLRDTFGQTSNLAFAKVERNPKVDPQLFRFTPPKGADVLEDR